MIQKIVNDGRIIFYNVGEVVLFKVKDYTTVLVGRREVEKIKTGENFSNHWIFYVERGDGTRYRYSGYEVEWFKVINECSFK